MPKIASRPAKPALKNAKDALLRSELVQSIRNILVPEEPGPGGEGGGPFPSRHEPGSRGDHKLEYIIENERLQYGEMNMSKQQIKSYRSLGNINMKSHSQNYIQR